MKVYDAIEIAKYIIFYCYNNGYPISNLKLQKLLYFAQAKFLVDANKSCFDNQIEAWDYGPVVPDVYRKYRIYGGLNIPYIDSNNRSNNISDEDKGYLDDILKDASKCSASKLVNITHQQSPWIDARKTGSKVITNKAIKDFFK